MKKILFVFGTRPEAIKISPVIHEIRKSQKIRGVVCSTGQHREMTRQVLEFFQIIPDYDLDLMTPDQSLNEVSSSVLSKIDPVLKDARPDLVFVQGDTNSTVMGAMASFNRKIGVAHLEAGLRSGSKLSPFPEEINRILTSRLADFHFAATPKAKENLLREGINPELIFLVGNSVVDALLWGLKKVDGEEFVIQDSHLGRIDFSKRVILVTGHRRESFGQPLLNICLAIKEIATEEDVEIVYPVHLNPNVNKPVYSILGDNKHVHLLPPLDYPSMIRLMKSCYFIISDSGGIQEEAPSLHKPVLVTREVTERMEGIECGVTKLVGTSLAGILQEAKNLLNNKEDYNKMAAGSNPYGDGTTSVNVRAILEKVL